MSPLAALAVDLAVGAAVGVWLGALAFAAWRLREELRALADELERLEEGLVSRESPRSGRSHVVIRVKRGSEAQVQGQPPPAPPTGG